MSVRVQPRAPLAATAGALVAGFVALLARPALLPAHHDPTGRLVALFVLLGLAGACLPVPAADVPPPLRQRLWALALGSTAFLVAWAATGGPGTRHPSLFRLLVLNALAAVAEEAFFRRLLYGTLRPLGSGVAVAGSAVAFAVAHITVWGLWVLPLDLAAGLLLSWQRAASGGWSVPAVTHVLANTLALL